jgi:hypothetical protein
MKKTHVCFACYYRDNPEYQGQRNSVACSLIGYVMFHHFGTVDVIHDALCPAHKEIVSRTIRNTKKKHEGGTK